MIDVKEQIDSQLAISLTDVSKSYKHFKLNNISLNYQRGMVAGLIGPNGAGKSTTMRIMMGLIQPDSGRVEVFGSEISSNLAASKQEIGYFSDDMRLYKPETVGWHMQFIQSMYPSWDQHYANELVERFGLITDQTVKGLSHGQRVKAMLLLILARRPKLLILDEPTNGLDPVARHEVLQELMRVVEDPERTILYSSHNTQDVEQICDWVTFIDRGRVISSDNREKFLENWKRIKLTSPDDWTIPAMDGLRVESAFRSLKVLTHNQYTEAALQQLRSSGAQIESVDSMSLEEIFINTVMRGREGVES